MKSMRTWFRNIDNFCNKEDIIFALYVICPVVPVFIKMDKAQGLFIKKHVAEKAWKPVQ